MPKSKNEDPSSRLSLINKIITLLKKIIGKQSHVSETLLPNNTDNTAKLIVDNCFKFTNKSVEDIIIPRSDIFGIKVNATIEEINKTFTEGSRTRIIVYKENLDDIVGFVHIKDLYKNFIQTGSYKLTDIIRKPITVAPSTKLITLLSKMQQERTHLAIVVDEYGGTEGIVTNEDILETLVGEIHDEHDKNTIDEYKLLDDTTLITSSRVKVEKVQELMKIVLDNDDYDCDTIGGLVIAKAGKVPTIGATLNLDGNIQVEILEANKRLLKKIKIKVLKNSST